MNIVTREEYKTYTRIKNKMISTSEKGTQTKSVKQQPPTIIFAPFPMKRKRNGNGYDNYDIYNSSSDSENNDDSEDGECSSSHDEEKSEVECSDKDVSGDNVYNDEKLKTSVGNITKKRLKLKSKQFYGFDDVEYYKRLCDEEQQAIDEIESNISCINDIDTPLRFKILTSGMDMKLMSIAISKIDQLSMLESSSSEYYKLSTYIENLSKIPIGKYKQLPISNKSNITEISSFLDTTRNKLNNVVYGHKDAKDQIIRLLAKWISNPSSKGLVIGIEGVHGIGKTSLIKDGICEVLGLPFGFITLGGISDGSYMVGHSYTYEGSRWGKIVDVLMKVGCMNPVLYFDELDKISTTTYGQEIANLLIHLTDSSQNDSFQDKYFSDINIDLSRCLIIFSYNNEEMINPILKDRMTVIRTKGYNTKDKIEISKDYMIPKMLPEFGFEKDTIIIDDDVIQYIISLTDEEEGVRNLKRSLEELISQLNLHRLLKQKPFINGNGDVITQLQVTHDIVNMFLKKTKKDMNTSYSMMYV